MKKRNILNTSFFKILLLALCIFLIYRLVFDFEGISANFMGVISFILNLLGYFVWGFAIAFILNQVMMFFEKIFRFIKKDGARHAVAVMATYMVALGVIVLFFVAIIPVIGNSVSELVSNIPLYAAKLREFYDTAQTYLLEHFNVELTDFNHLDFTAMLNQLADFVLNGEGLGAVTHWLFETTNVLINFLFGFVISIYMLLDKEKFLLEVRNVTEAILSERKFARCQEIGKRANEIFSKFLFGKLMDSTLIGAISYVVFLIIGVKYPLLLAFIVGITNIIPYFGPIVGAVLVGGIVLFTNSGLYYFIVSMIMVIIIQQVDGWLIGPKILHGQIGVSPLLIIAGVSIGGSLAGFVGMVVGVPLLALVKELFYDGYILKKLQARKEKKLSEDNDDLA